MCIGLIMSIPLFGAFLSSSQALMEKEKYKVAHNGTSGTGEISKGGSRNLNRPEGVKTIKTFVLSLFYPNFISINCVQKSLKKI